MIMRRKVLNRAPLFCKYGNFHLRKIYGCHDIKVKQPSHRASELGNTWKCKCGESLHNRKA